MKPLCNPLPTTVSVVVITRNRLEKLKRCLASIAETLPDAGVIIVDNYSTDGTRLFLEQIKSASLSYPLSHQIEMVLLDRNHGPARAKNIGIQRALQDSSQSQLIILLDDDAWLEQLDISKIQSYFAAHPNIGIIAPHIFYPNGRDQESVRSYPTLLSVFWRGTRLYQVFPNVPWYKKYIGNDFEHDHVVDWAIGACQIIRADAFRKIGLLDVHYSFWYEDLDFCLRAWKAGYSTLYWHDAHIMHDYARTSAKGLNKELLRHCGSICRFFWNRLVRYRFFNRDLVGSEKSQIETD